MLNCSLNQMHTVGCMILLPLEVGYEMFESLCVYTVWNTESHGNLLIK